MLIRQKQKKEEGENPLPFFIIIQTLASVCSVLTSQRP